ncbi:hypothetical protein MKX01_020842 [Papaver californicum]|nr:hypothetical protein MKX01_020842 [Papaver californicum]
MQSSSTRAVTLSSMRMKTQQSDLAPNKNILVVLMILLLIQSCFASSQHQNLMRWNHPKRKLLDRINRDGPYVGIVMAISTEEMALQSSGFFIPNCHHPSVDLSGRKFNIGSIKGTKVVYVMSGQRRLNAGITVQILLDVFDIHGIVHYGIAGSANNSLSYGDVSIPKYVAFTGSWYWKNLGSKNVDRYTEMKIGNYNLPEEGQNLLGEIEFKPEEFFSVGQPMKEVFWLEVDKTWFNLAAQLKGLEFRQCENATSCLPRVPKVEYGLRGATADIFLDNAAYRKFLFNEFQVSTVDEESSAVVMAAMSSGVPSIVIRGVSDLAGGQGTPVSTFLGSLAAVNTLNVTIRFIELIGASKNTLVMERE